MADNLTPDTYYDVTLKVKLPKYWVNECLRSKSALVELINDYRHNVSTINILPVNGEPVAAVSIEDRLKTLEANTHVPFDFTVLIESVKFLMDRDYEQRLIQDGRPHLHLKKCSYFKTELEKL